MFLNWFNTETIKIVSNNVFTGQYKNNGNPIYEDVEKEVQGLVAFKSSDNLVSGSFGQYVQLRAGEIRLAFEYGTDVTEADLFVVRGENYKLVGFPEKPNNLFGGNFLQAPVVVTVKKMESAV